ncbi:heavy metal translocating P-type ATPase [Ulvibacter litoralis]|uniref:Cu+-exporting ATPase n=1 Tax=Ulvibacter litoralis TaxID=227084 RepID=A0A1G7CHT6_9FLAO|nr:heavy metal translocating P-type ATPase metal-binding domain-containing protein [Ulvibacter litoralis]GHC47487.1 ATPase [Ulvibacter litoralis]SDE38256.1 Cu+-exporting ATPase [Ulvibacter litoralis]
MTSCFHCGDPCDEELIVHHDKNFCCYGCKTVFDILNDNDLNYYYDLEKTPGNSPKISETKFEFLDNPNIVGKLLEFDEGNTQIVSFLIPSIHCSSCIWVLENLNKLQPAVSNSQVNFPEKTVRITFNSETLTVKQLVLLLAQIGYEPYISLEDAKPKERSHNKKLIFKLGVAGFAFGNVMFLSFPEYFQETEFWLDSFKHLFRWLMFSFSLPVVFYSGQDYFISAYKGLRSKILNIDVPIALGISVLFIRSTIDIVFDLGSGFFDSLTGLVFFLLLGKFFQQKTYAYLSFERDYKSYFPMAVTQLLKKEDGTYSEIQSEVHHIKKGDRLLIRNNELISVDAVLLKGEALIDYSFVTGEANPVSKASGDTLYAGGKQQGGVLEIEVLKPVSQSYLTQLWSNDIFSKNNKSPFQSITDRISKRFTVGVLSIAFLATLVWLIYDASHAFNVFTAVLIVACPCAIALAAPFTLGNILRLFGKKKCYLKEASVIEQMAKIDTLVFDKTGTLTAAAKNIIRYEGVDLSEEEEELLATSLRTSNHPLSRALYKELQKNNICTLDEYEEILGKGITARIAKSEIKIGSHQFVTNESDIVVSETNPNRTGVHISTNNTYKGCYIFQNQYREGIAETMQTLANKYELIVLSGDNEGEREYLSELLPKGTKLYFNQKPEDKLQFIDNLQRKGKSVLMMGDGLNDAGALKQSNVGIALSENTNVFTPACDGILDARVFNDIPNFLSASKRGIQIIQWSFLFSLFYNIIGLSFAVTGHLKPVIAAILMPLSSISIVIFTTLLVRFYVGTLLKR